MTAPATDTAPSAATQRSGFRPDIQVLRAIEEQFYLLWPALLAVRFWLCRRSERRLMVTAAVLTGASFLACGLLMNVSQPWNFFSLPTRAWELGAGALVAFLMRSRAWWLRTERTGLLAWAGLAGLVAVALTFDEATAFPGAAAALPVARPPR